MEDPQAYLQEQLKEFKKTLAITRAAWTTQCWSPDYQEPLQKLAHTLNRQALDIFQYCEDLEDVRSSPPSKRFKQDR